MKVLSITVREAAGSRIDAKETTCYPQAMWCGLLFSGVLLVSACSGPRREFTSGSGGAPNDGSTNGGVDSTSVDSGSTGGDSLGAVGGNANAGPAGSTAAGGAPIQGGGGDATEDTAGAPAAGAAGSGNSATPPTVVSITPKGGATGVTADTPVKITFSEPMDTLSVEAALTVSSFDAQSVTVSWASGGKVATITPSGGWKYATGTNPAMTAQKYTVTVGTTAKDAQGDTLTNAFSASFTSARRITQTFGAVSAGSYSTYGHAMGAGPVMCASATDTVFVDEWVNPISAGTYYAFITFDVSSLGAPGPSNLIEGATLRATQSTPQGDFYGTHTVTAAHMVYHAIDKGVLPGSVIANLGTFSANAGVLHPKADTLASFKSAFDAGDKWYLFRLAPTDGADDGNIARFVCGDLSLEVTHLVP